MKTPQPNSKNRPAPRKPAVILLSGGLDSATVLAIARAEGFECHALSFRYGQRHAVELACAQRIARALGAVQHRIIDIDLASFGGSALTDPSIDVPHTAGDPHTIPPTYVPARNTIFLSLALAWAETLQCDDLFIGVNAVDYSGYPDCRPAFIAAFERMANLATRITDDPERHITLHAPLQELTKAQIIRKGRALGVDYTMTSSCYDPAPDGTACGTCDSCRLRARGFAEADKKTTL